MNNTQLVPIGDMQIMARVFAKSGLILGAKTEEQTMTLMLVAQAEGRHPASVAADYHIIQGRPTLKSEAMLARFQQAGGKVEWHDHSNDKVSGTFSHPQGGSLRVDWDMARAKSAGLGTKDNWRQYPRQMLRARVISEGVRAVFPAVLNGMYTPEEVRDFEPAREYVQLRSANIELAALPAPEPEAISVEVSPAPSEFEQAFSGREAEVEAFLRHRKQLTEGQTWRDASEYLEARVAGKVPAFLKAVSDFNKEAKA